MKYFLFEGKIDHSEETNKLIDFMNSEGDLTIGLNSQGGTASVGYFLLKILNDNKERITLQGLDSIYSIAFYIFAEFKGKKAFCISTKGMWHYGNNFLNIDDRGKPTYPEDKLNKENLKYHLKFSNEIAEKYMTLKELKKFKKGNDVFFGFQRMQEMFPLAEIIS